jgi:hypothetical protein
MTPDILARVDAKSVILSEAKNLAVGRPNTEILRRGSAAPQNDINAGCCCGVKK